MAEQGREQMPFQMMNRQGRHPQRKRERFGEARADKQRPCQPGPRSVGNGVDILPIAAGTREDLARERQEEGELRLGKIKRGRRRRTWSREASSGTTPP